jgi:hypothetical protein
MMGSWTDFNAAQDGMFHVKHAVLTFSGTWAAPGTGYCSWVAQAANQDLVYEVPVVAPWSFGPVGGAVDAPSYKQSVKQGVDWAIGWIESHPRETFMLGGYSQGAEAASRVFRELQPGGRLADRRADFVAGYTFGNPMRQAGHTFPGGADPGGAGIAPVQLQDCPPEWHDHANAGDIYTAAPVDQTGTIMRDVYVSLTEIQLNDPVAFATAEVRALLKLMSDAGGVLPLSMLGQIGGAGALLGMGGLFGGLGGLSGGGGAQTPGAIAAVHAAILGLQFIATNPPTLPHISYEFTEAAPGITHIQHAVNHVNERACAVAARIAA